MSNLLYGLRPYGRIIQAGPFTDGGSKPTPDESIGYLPDQFTIIAYNTDGTQSAIFGAGSEANNLANFEFELIETGCGAATFTFNSMPTNSELDYKQRIDIHLFNDPRPWWSGYILSRPIEGTTAKDKKFTAHGYYNILEKVIIKQVYQNTEVSQIVADIARQIERKVGLAYNGNKIINTGYTISYLDLDGVTVKEALNQLSDFALDYVYGVDEYRQLYFKPRVVDVNEQARFWLGYGTTTYEPSFDITKIVNHAYIKGAAVDDSGEQWLAEVENVESQLKYGVQEAIWSLPSAYIAADAIRWGNNQLEYYKEPVKSAKVGGVNLEYPRADGSFFVRKLSTDGLDVISSYDGVAHEYPIS